MYHFFQRIVNEYDQEIPQSQTADKTMITAFQPFPIIPIFYPKF